jgi:tetratricopeptide (TPR) repeat protein
VIGGLSKVRSLRVISRTSAMRLKDTPLEVRDIGRDYGVRYVVTGSVRRAGPKLRVAAEIVDSLLDAPVWAGRFDGSMDDPFDIQDSVAAGIVEALRVSLTPEEQRRMTARPIADPRAYECRRKAMAGIITFSREGLEQAEALLNEGLEIVGDNAHLFAVLGSVHWQYVNAGIDVSEDRLARARHWLDKALALDPDLVDALTTVAWMQGSRGEVVPALRNLDRALEADPNHSFALAFHAVLDWTSGRNDQLAEMVARSQAIDPWDLWGVFLKAVLCAYQGDVVGRDRYLRRGTEISPSPLIEYMVGHILAGDGEFADADPNDLGVVFCRAGVAAFDGRTDDVRALMAREDVGTLTSVDPQWGWYAGSTYALAGLADEGIAALETAVRQGFSNVMLIEGRDATLSSLRSHSRFPAVLQLARDTLAQANTLLAESRRATK